MKIIFLDVDGVLNTRRSMMLALQGVHPPFSRLSLDLICQRRLQRFIERNHAAVKRGDLPPDDMTEIVLSSTWRMFEKEAEKVFAWMGWKEPWIACTERSDLCRGQQILNWMHNPTTRDFVVVDDDSGDMWGIPADRLVLTDNATGLQIEHVVRIAEILKVPLWP